MGAHVDTARTWRGRLADLGLLGPGDRKRPGRPAAVAMVVPGTGPPGRLRCPRGHSVRTS
ncbi:hypothetical protein ABZX85_47095 [Streptomyces sp. NPDC004539]|uniref:hypothetical protein n=1 Tax=Streptomyces sp. NPDC004539 TaxID=3154280 RepID=UPI00339E04FB